MPELSAPPRSATVSELLEAATRIFRRTLAKTLPLGMFAILLVALPNFYWLTTGKPLDVLHPPMDTRFWVLAAVGFVGYEWLAAALMVRQRDLLSGRAPDLGRDLATASARLATLVVSAVVGWLLVFVGALALLVPGVYALVCLLLLQPVVLFDTRDPLRAVARSFSLARPMWVKVMASAVIALLVFMICAFAAAACLGIVESLLIIAGLQPAAVSALSAACGLGVQAVALVYFNALWLVLYTTASSSA
jgi:uncharacterized membrane protein (Fun14 family)